MVDEKETAEGVGDQTIPPPPEQDDKPYPTPPMKISGHGSYKVEVRKPDGSWRVITECVEDDAFVLSLDFTAGESGEITVEDPGE